MWIIASIAALGAVAYLYAYLQRRWALARLAALSTAKRAHFASHYSSIPAPVSVYAVPQRSLQADRTPIRSRSSQPRTPVATPHGVGTSGASKGLPDTSAERSPFLWSRNSADGQSADGNGLFQRQRVELTPSISRTSSEALSIESAPNGHTMIVHNKDAHNLDGAQPSEMITFSHVHEAASSGLQSRKRTGNHTWNGGFASADAEQLMSPWKKPRAVPLEDVLSAKKRQRQPGDSGDSTSPILLMDPSSRRADAQHKRKKVPIAFLDRSASQTQGSAVANPPATRLRTAAAASSAPALRRARSSPSTDHVESGEEQRPDAVKKTRRSAAVDVEPRVTVSGTRHLRSSQTGNRPKSRDGDMQTVGDQSGDREFDGEDEEDTPAVHTRKRPATKGVDGDSTETGASRQSDLGGRGGSKRAPERGSVGQLPRAQSLNSSMSSPPSALSKDASGSLRPTDKPAVLKTLSPAPVSDGVGVRVSPAASTLSKSSSLPRVPASPSVAASVAPSLISTMTPGGTSARGRVTLSAKSSRTPSTATVGRWSQEDFTEEDYRIDQQKRDEKLREVLASAKDISPSVDAPARVSFSQAPQSPIRFGGADSGVAPSTASGESASQFSFGGSTVTTNATLASNSSSVSSAASSTSSVSLPVGSTSVGTGFNFALPAVTGSSLLSSASGSTSSSSLGSGFNFNANAAATSSAPGSTSTAPSFSFGPASGSASATGAAGSAMFSSGAGFSLGATSASATGAGQSSASTLGSATAAASATGFAFNLPGAAAPTSAASSSSQPSFGFGASDSGFSLTGASSGK